MAPRQDLYSRIVAWLKILLPLTALAILSTLFLLSKNIDPTTTIPFTTIDLRERARDQQLTSPEFAGVTEKGDLIAFRAVSAIPDPENSHRAFADTLSARIDFGDGSQLAFSADNGTIDQDTNMADLVGNVVIQSSAGYTVTTDQLISSISEIAAEAPGPIQGNGPPGRFSAGRMVIYTDPETDTTQMLFTDGVKLVYDPSETKD
ncbi:LPS export ABC transporter periplasmic protein LptC [Marimonas lutisalis]|uniref:LPS export ABC transporter periplasmic protein LptC n=1 Tax=Marimonas lutisalis TaxID=2545756 RepID=UPI0010F9EC68|nr:LPS export ABC transporter periplasmic protein LptC [Marimonas lutisalis]